MKCAKCGIETNKVFGCRQGQEAKGYCIFCHHLEFYEIALKEARDDIVYLEQQIKLMKERDVATYNRIGYLK